MTHEQLISAIAKACHEAFRFWSEANNDYMVPVWAYAGQLKQEQAKSIVRFYLSAPAANYFAYHDWWYASASEEDKRHPHYVAFDELPVRMKTKYKLFADITVALSTENKEANAHANAS